MRGGGAPTVAATRDPAVSATVRRARTDPRVQSAAAAAGLLAVVLGSGQALSAAAAARDPVAPGDQPVVFLVPGGQLLVAGDAGWHVHHKVVQV